MGEAGRGLPDVRAGDRLSAAEAWPTEDLATKAVDAAAKDLFERSNPKALTPWAELDAGIKLEIRQAVLPIVWAALTDLPDPRYAAFEEGRAAGSSDTAFEAEGYGNPPGLVYPHENPYPSGL